MDDARPLHSGDAAVLGITRQKRVDERATGVARRGVHHQARGLVHDQHVAVLVDHRQRNILGFEIQRRRIRDLQLNDLPRHDYQVVPDHRAVDGDVALGDQLLDICAG